MQFDPTQAKSTALTVTVEIDSSVLKFTVSVE